MYPKKPAHIHRTWHLMQADRVWINRAAALWESGWQEYPGRRSLGVQVLGTARRRLPVLCCASSSLLLAVACLEEGVEVDPPLCTCWLVEVEG
jgi:hypothetical protein